MRATQFRWCNHQTAPATPSARCCPSLLKQDGHSCHKGLRTHTIAAGGLFGGLQKMFGGQGPEPQQQDKQQQAPVPPAPKVMFPPYTVVKKGEVYDIRLYDVYPVVEMPYQQRAEGYAVLGAYIDGENESGSRFCYTQPVVMKYLPSGKKMMQMFVGAPRGQQASEPLPVSELPKPKASEQVQLSVAGGELVAVHKFEGYITPEAAAAARQRLVKALKKDGVLLAAEEASGAFRVGQYGAVYQLEARLNEMMLRIQV